MSAPLITARGLTKRYGKAIVVDGIDFEVAKGEIFGLLGPNGAGKTTTILMMLGLTEVSGGTIRVLDHDPVRQPLAVKRRVGYLPDQVGFYDNLTAADNLTYSARLMGIPAAERGKRIGEALARVRLADVAEKRVKTFSRGMRQRLGLAEIVMKRAEIAILDEPTSGLDPQATIEFIEMIDSLKRSGVSVLLSSHMLDQVQRVCDRVALFQNGRIVLMGPVKDLARQVLGAGFVVEVEADAASDLDARFGAIPGVSAVERVGIDRYRLTADRDVRPESARAVVAANGALRRLSVEDPSLEAIYTRFFSRQANQDGGQRDAA
jgi:ABC-2 type transport system ATP-binding protein